MHCVCSGCNLLKETQHDFWRSIPVSPGDVSVECDDEEVENRKHWDRISHIFDEQNIEKYEDEEPGGYNQTQPHDS